MTQSSLPFLAEHTPTNLLPYDGVVAYHGTIYKEGAALQYFATLLQSIEWKNDEAIIFGKHITTQRKVAWYAENNFAYTYSKITKQSLPFTPALLSIKNEVEILTQATYNSCLLNLYHNGKEGMGWHSDNEISLQKNGAIASVSFGAERKFCLKHKQTKHKIDLLLGNGSLLVMKDKTQVCWQHCLPKSARVTKARINLTFRNYVQLHGQPPLS